MHGNAIAAISVSNLLMDKPADFDKGKVEELARSIQHDGMILRPVVRPSKDLPGSYKVVAGRKRIYAAAKILGWTEVECDVTHDLDDEADESIELAENVFRTALSDEAENKALIRWYANYIKRNPNADRRRSAKTKTAAETDTLLSENSGEITAVSGIAKVSDIDETPGAMTSGATPKPFAKAVEETLGISASAAKRKARIARNLTEEQITVLAAENVNQGQIDAIAALGKGDAIDRRPTDRLRHERRGGCSPSKEVEAKEAGRAENGCEGGQEAKGSCSSAG
jgi:ParB/RepB/Spo0J family partition protein